MKLQVSEALWGAPMKLRVICVSICILLLAVVPAFAQTDLYDNGPINGTVDAWTFNYGFVPSNSFTLAQPGQVSGLAFGAWLFPGDVLQSVEISITSNELGGTTYFDQVVNTSQTGCVLNQYGYNVCTETAMFDGPALNAGTYWLNLQNGVVSSGNPVFWDQNNGPSSASENSLGTLQSESFTILGGSTSTTGTTPEPATLMLFGTGVAGLCAMLRRKLL